VPAELDDLKGLGDEDVLARAAGADGILLGARFRLSSERILRLSQCRVIVRYGVGVDNVDLDAAEARGIVVSYVPDYCVEEVSNHALALLLALHRRLFAYDARAREGRTGIETEHPIERLSLATLAVLGFGRIGREVTRKARAFSLRVLVQDPLVPGEEVRAAGAVAAGLEEALGAADAVSLHLPLTSQTRGLLGRERLLQMKRGALLVNVGRGGLVDEEALAGALASGHLGGAGLDVTAVEPLPASHPLLAAPNLVLTPHVAWYSTGAQRELQTKAAEEAARVLRGEPALNALTPGANPR
jgi:D-3-phosphoglycerate dehydrogenase / 2-oxoglutarate reductase